MSTSVQLLQSALDDYRKAESNVVAHRAKAERSQHEAQSAIDNHDISEGAASTKLALSQVLSARLKSRKLELNKTLDELGKTVTRASQELNGQVRDAWGKRRDIIGRRGCEAMGIPLKSLELGELDTVLALSEQLNAIRNFEVAIYNAQYIEKITQKPVQYVTTNVGDREVQEELTTDREPQLSQELDIEHLVTSAQQIFTNFSGLEKEMEKRV